MGRPQLSDDQVDDLLDHMTKLVDKLRTDHRKLWKLRADDRDGYPTRSLAAGGGHRGGGHADPVANIVAARERSSDPASNALRTLYRALLAAEQHLDAASTLQ